MTTFNKKDFKRKKKIVADRRCAESNLVAYTKGREDAKREIAEKIKEMKMDSCNEDFENGYNQALGNLIHSLDKDKSRNCWLKNENRNCECDEPEPDGSVDSLNFGGRFERCKICNGRIWH